ncbi:kinase-like protein [Testicularia cyperi]|uniref:Kinase-like protein n=1 Tax=Testicularia cyperi TaxID=1882483 RepID=A0A317XL50_9BASI|nr:kinase-like protein [Testicularia cyperi]
MATVVPRAKKQRTLPDEITGLDPLPHYHGESLHPSMLAHQHPMPPAHQQYQPPAEYASGSHQLLHPSIGMSSGSRPMKPTAGFQKVNEMIGGKVQEVFVIDDDSPPPLDPLSVQSARDPHLVNNYTTYTNGHAGPAYPSNHAGYAAPDARYENGSSAAKGKRKAQDGALGSLPESQIGMLPHDADLIAPAPDMLGGVQGGVPVQKRRKRSHPVQGLAPLPPGGSLYPAPPPGGGLSADMGASGAVVPAKRRGPELTQSKVEPNYRGGYPAGTGTLDYHVARYEPAANAIVQQHQQHQQGYEGTASTRDSYASNNSYAVAPVSNLPVDDKEGHFIPREGEYVTSRYKILRLLGQGTFGKVVECYDKKARRYVAIKIIRAIQKYRDASQIEIRVLRTLRENDPNNENKCIHLLDTFNFKNHVCIVSELLGKSVFDFLKENQFKPFPAVHIWQFAKQLLQSVAFLHRLNLVHTDLKPENILLVSSEYSVMAASRRSNAKRKHVLNNTEIRLIDFGSATFNEEFHSSVVSTRHYRAPEIILQMGWSFPCDVWSIGCILVEFFTGEALFQTHDNLEHLAMMEAVLGSMPDDYRRKAETYKPDLFKNGALDYPNVNTPKSSRKYVRQMKKLQEIITTPSNPAAYQKHNSRFLHLLRQLLEFDPNKRIKVSAALKHPYFELDPEKDFPPF